MNDKEFQELRRKIHKKMRELFDLQKLHREQTGQDYIISGYLPEPEKDGSLFLCPVCKDRILKPGHCHNPYCSA